MRLLPPLLLALLAGALPTHHAFAAESIDSDLVKQGMAAYDELDYPKCTSELEKALTESLTRVEKAAALKTLGFCRVALDQNDAARLAFQKLLGLEASFDFDRTISPRVRAVFDEAKKIVAASRAQAAPLLADLYPPKPKAGLPLTVSGTHPTEKADKVLLFYRVRGEPSFNKVEAVPRLGGHFELTIPGVQVRGPAVEYFVSVLDEASLVVAQSGTVEQPQVAELETVPRKSKAVPVAVGVVVALVVAGGVGAGVGIGVMRANAPATVMIFPQ